MQGRIEHPRPQIYLGLTVGIWASLALDSELSFDIFTAFKAFLGKVCIFVTFTTQVWG